MKMEKANKIKQERAQLLEKRSLMHKQIELQKYAIQEKIQKLKQGKISPDQIMKTLSFQQNWSSSIISNKSELKIRKKETKTSKNNK